MANIPNFRGPICDIKKNFLSTKQVFCEFWQNEVCEHFGTPLEILTNYCELTRHALFTKLIGSLNNTLKITFLADMGEARGFSIKSLVIN